MIATYNILFRNLQAATNIAGDIIQVLVCWEKILPIFHCQRPSIWRFLVQKLMFRIETQYQQISHHFEPYQFHFHILTVLDFVDTYLETQTSFLGRKRYQVTKPTRYPSETRHSSCIINCFGFALHFIIHRQPAGLVRRAAGAGQSSSALVPRGLRHTALLSRVLTHGAVEPRPDTRRC